MELRAGEDEGECFPRRASAGCRAQRLGAEQGAEHGFGDARRVALGATCRDAIGPFDAAQHGFRRGPFRRDIGPADRRAGVPDRLAEILQRADGALRRGGKTVSYHRTTSGSFGLQAGAQSSAVFILFMTDDALARFENSRGWTAGVDASVTLLTVGANAQATSATVQQPVVGYVLTNQGLMAGITVDGTRVTRLKL